MKELVQKGYNNPSDGEEIIVELENGSITGAIYQVVDGEDLHSQACFKDVEHIPFCGLVVAWFPSMVQKIKESSI